VRRLLTLEERRAGLTESNDAAAVLPHFKVVHQRDGRFHWELINPHGTAAARSMEAFDTEAEAVANAEYAQQLISRAPLRRS
jgi:hypothetical protein